MNTDIYLYFLWISLSASIVSLAFLLARSSRLQQEIQRFQTLNSSLQDLYTRECERRAIAEEKASRVLDLEQAIQQRTESIEKLLGEQSELKRQLAEKETQ